MGRKKMKTNAKFDIRLRVDEELHERLAEVAKEEGLPLAAFIRSTLLRELKRRGKEEE